MLGSVNVSTILLLYVILYCYLPLWQDSVSFVLTRNSLRRWVAACISIFGRFDQIGTTRQEDPVNLPRGGVGLMLFWPRRPVLAPRSKMTYLCQFFIKYHLFFMNKQLWHYTTLSWAKGIMKNKQELQTTGWVVDDWTVIAGHLLYSL